MNVPYVTGIGILRRNVFKGKKEVLQGYGEYMNLNPQTQVGKIYLFSYV